ncbi:MarR family winged helix-turn-helix transcriptional regulator [Falsigemmobacter intermedius]|jgi:MarR family transcriptional regulator for hemolysin|nr:MarR family transcriptional regulator [Falsigemmobacter intermedius]
MSREGDILDLMSATARRLRTIYDRRAAEHGLTLARVRVLLCLRDREGLTQLELAQALQIEAPTLKRQIDALVRDGYLERRPLPAGGRGKGLYLTPFGQTHALTEFSRKTRQTLLEGVSGEDLDVFQAVLQRLHLNIDRLEEL